MIAYIQGKILHLEPSKVVIQAGGLGYDVHISLNTYSSIKSLKECELATYLQVKEDSHTLYGFINQSEKSSFLSLIGVKGVGPSAALSILSAIGVKNLINAIATEDHTTIKSVKGIGLKTSQRIVLELKDKLSHLTGSQEVSGQGDNNENININKLKKEGLAALMTLGISKTVAEKSLNEIVLKEGNNISIEDLIKLALKP